jgi:hypothetical protein
MNRLESQQGVAGLLAVLFIGVLLSAGAVVLNTAVYQQKSAGEEEEYTRALDLAEAGIEKLLSEDVWTASLPANTETTKYSRTMVTNNGNISIPVGRTWDVEVTDNHNIRLTGLGDSPEMGGALVVSVLGYNGTTPAVVRQVYFFGTATQAASAGLPNAIPVTGSTQDINLGNAYFNSVPIKKLVRIKALIKNMQIGIEDAGGSPALPNQQVILTVDQSSDTSNASVREYVSIPQLPSIFDYALFSGTTIVKN